MPRSNRPRRGGRRRRGGTEPAGVDRAPSGIGHHAREAHPDGVFVVRRVAGAGSDKAYRCPGCDQEVRPGTAHVVVWSAEPIGTFGDVGDRRHWHTPCWAARARRR